MQLLPRAGWRYAALLILLFGIAAIAVREILVFMEPPRVRDADYLTIAILLCALTFGFMLIASAFGLWAIRFSAEAESVRSISTIVESMDYIHDGVVAIDRRGDVIAVNPAARRFLSASSDGRGPLQSAFDSLSDDDVRILIRQEEPQELERETTINDQRRSLRFRSQPAHAGTLLLVSDVTAMSADRIRRRQNAYFQLLGHIARGVANDFNDLLCGISGHAAIMQRNPDLPEALRDSAAAIESCTERGLQLAGHLAHLAASGKPSGASATVEADMRAAAALLADGLDPSWKITVVTADALPSVLLGGSQIEQVVYSLGLLAAEFCTQDRSLWVTAAQAGNGPVPDRTPHSLTILISTVSPNMLAKCDNLRFRSPSGEGVLDSVVQAILNEAGGILDLATPTPDSLIYRVTLPVDQSLHTTRPQDVFPRELDAYMRGWQIMLAGQSQMMEKQAVPLQLAGLLITRSSTITAMLAAIEHQAEPFKALVMECKLLGDDPDSLLRTIARLCPQAGIVILHADAHNRPETTVPFMLHESSSCSSAQLRRAIIDARTAAVQQRQEAT